MSLASLLSLLAAIFGFLVVLLPATGILTRTVAIWGTGLGLSTSVALATDAPLLVLALTGSAAAIFVVLIYVMGRFVLRSAVNNNLRQVVREAESAIQALETLRDELDAVPAEADDLKNRSDLSAEELDQAIATLHNRVQRKRDEFAVLSALGDSATRRLAYMQSAEYARSGLGLRAFKFTKPRSRREYLLAAIAILLPVAEVIFLPPWPLVLIVLPLILVALIKTPRSLVLRQQTWTRLLPIFIVVLAGSAVIAGAGGMVFPYTTAKYEFTSASQQLLPNGIYAQLGATVSQDILMTCGSHPRVVLVNASDVLGATVIKPRGNSASSPSLFGIVWQHQRVRLGVSEAC